MDARTQKIDQLAHELDLVVFELELPPSEDDANREVERRRLRETLERIRDDLMDLAGG